jgi:glycolate oxidase FAD binding subunit
VNDVAVPPSIVTDTISQWQALIKKSPKVHVTGNCSKSGFHHATSDASLISTQALQGIVSYDPQEFVVTVFSGTRVSHIIKLLADKGQYLPFDPLLAESGATIGGTVASNASGSGRFRFGGIRDFLLGVRFIDGRGNCIRGGGQVVKNAAGFDFPKLMVGSQGKLGLVYELTFKVFPRPEAYVTLLSKFQRLEDAITSMTKLAVSQMDLEALDLMPVDSGINGYLLAMRIGGIVSAIPNRIARLRDFVPVTEFMEHQADADFWQAAANVEWTQPQESLYKFAINSKSIPEFEAQLIGKNINRRYCVGGNVAWIATDLQSNMSQALGPAQMFFSDSSMMQHPQPYTPGPFGQAIKRALDPYNKFI